MTKAEEKVFKIVLGEYETPEFDETVVNIDGWYDRHTRLWTLQKMNKDGYQIGDAAYIYGKKDAMAYKKQLEEEAGI